MKDRFRKLLVILAILGLAGFLANLAIDNPYTHRIVRSAINSKVKSQTNLVIDFRALKVSLLPLGIDLYGITVASSKAPSQPIVTASRIQADVSLWSIIMGEPRLSEIEGNGVEMVWPPPFGFEGILKESWSATSPSSLTWPPDLSLPVDQISLRNSSIYLDVPLEDRPPRRASWFSIFLIGVDADLDLKNWQELDLRLEVLSANAAVDASSLLEDAKLDATVELLGDQISVSRLRVDGHRLKMDGTLLGELRRDRPPRSKLRLVPTPAKLKSLAIHGEARFTGDLSVLGSYLDVGGTRGKVDGQFKTRMLIPFLDSEPSSFVLEGEGQIQDGYLDGFHLFDSKAKFRVTPEALEFPDIHVLMGDQLFGKAQGSIQFDDQVSYEFKGQPSRLHLVDLLRALTVDFDVFDTAISSPDLVLKGTGDPFHMEVTATGTFEDIVLPDLGERQPKWSPPSCKLNVHLFINEDFLDLGRSNGHCFQDDDHGLWPDPLPPAPNGTIPTDVAVTGHFHFNEAKGLDISATSTNFQLSLARYFLGIDLMGTGPVSTRIHGPYDGVLVDGSFALANAAAASIPLGNVSGRFSVDETAISWKDLHLRPESGGDVTSSSGRISFDGSMPMKASLAANNIQTTTVRNVFQVIAPDLDLEFGIKDLKANLNGPLLEPFSYRGDLRADLDRISLDEETLADRVTVDLKSDHQGWTGRPVVIQKGSLGLDGEIVHRRSSLPRRGLLAKWGLSEEDELHLKFSSRNLANMEETSRPGHLAGLPFVGTYLQKAELTGLIDLKGELTGKIANLQGTFDGMLAKPGVQGSSLPPIEVRGFVDKSKFDIMVQHAGTAVEGRLSFDLAKTGIPYEWFMSFTRLDLRALGSSIFHSDPRNFAYLTADWHMQGKFSDWWRSTGEFQITDFRAKFVRDLIGQTRATHVNLEHPVALQFTETGWKFNNGQDLLLTGDHIQIRIFLEENLPPEKLSLHLDGVVDMDLAKKMLDQVDSATGKLQLKADVTGPVSDPDIFFELTDLKPNPFIAATWKPVSIGLADVRPPLRNMRLRLLYERGQLVIDSFSAEKGGGRVTANGSLNLSEEEGTESRIDITFDSASVVYPVAFLKSFESQLSGNLILTGNSLPLKVAGDIRIDRASSTQEVDIRDEIINALRRQSFKTEAIAEQPMVAFDLNLTADRAIKINNRNVKTALSANLHVGGTNVSPVVSGQIEVDQGKFIYKRDFEITRGLITFDSPVRVDPSLDILAVSEVGNYRVYIAITGRASNASVEFSIDPPTREDGSPISKVEILVLLSRGSLPDAGKSIGDTQNAATSEAVNLIMGQFEEPVEKLFDLSGQNVVRNVYIDTYPSEEGPVPRLNLPLDLGEDFDVVVKADQTSSQLSAEYALHENINLSGNAKWEDESKQTQSQSAATDADIEVDLKFRFSFD